MGQRVLLNQNMIATQASSTLAAPTDGSSGVAINASPDWMTSNMGPMAALVSIVFSTGADLSSAKLYGYRNSQWYAIGDINGGVTFSGTAAIGFAQVVQMVGVFDRLAVGGTLSSGTAIVTFEPIEVLP